jgi:hypothetical protein
MANFSWATGVNGEWSTAADWTPALVPNDPAADVTIDAPTATSYQVTIGAGELETVHSLTMNAVNNLLGSNRSPYNAAVLEIDGTLAFGAGSPGLLAGSLQTFLLLNGGTIINPGTINGFIQGQGNVLLTGTNGFYVTNWLQSLAAVITVDVKSIAEMTGNTLFDGIFEAKGPGGVINLGGPRQNLIVNIATVEGPPLIPGGWTELILNGPITSIGEWNGAGYVSLETTLTDIAARGTVDVIGGRNYTTANTLAIETGGLLNLQAGIVTTATLNINGGEVQGSGTISSNVINNGDLMALGGVMEVVGSLTGAGMVQFDVDHKTGTMTASGAVLEVHAAVGSGQTFLMNGDDTLVIDSPGVFTGTIDPMTGDTIVLGAGFMATSASSDGHTLILKNGAQTVGGVALGGNVTGDNFAVTAVPGGTAIHVLGPNFSVTDTTTGVTTATAGDPYTGPVAGLQNQFLDLTTDSLSITASAPNSFIHTGSGTDAINVSKANGTNVLDGGGGSNFLVGGTGADTFFADARNAASSIFSTVANFHSGDNATIFGVNATNFTLSLVDNAGAAGFTGVAIGFTAPGQPTVNVVLSGFTAADMTNGRLTGSFGTTPDLPGLPGSQFFQIHAN